jgi:hypothetical protein
MPLVDRINADLSTVDPIAILRSIANDAATPATARVQVCKALLAVEDGSRPGRQNLDPISQRALALLSASGREN